MEEWNVTLKGDHLWTNMLVGEVFPSTMTPSSWSVWEEILSNLFVGDVPSFGGIAGRPYLNYSLTYSFLLKLLRDHERVMARIRDAIAPEPPAPETIAIRPRKADITVRRVALVWTP